MYIAKRRMRFGMDGRLVAPGDPIPDAEGLHRFKLKRLIKLGWIAEVSVASAPPSSEQAEIEPEKEIEPLPESEQTAQATEPPASVDVQQPHQRNESRKKHKRGWS